MAQSTQFVPSNRKAAVFALMAFGFFATHDVLVKFLGQFYAPFQIVFFSVLFGFPLVTIMLMRDVSEGSLIPVHPWWTALRTLAAVMGGIGAFFAFTLLPLTQAYAILFAIPLLITILSIPVLGEKVGARRWGAVIVGLIGVLIVLRPGSADLTVGHAAALMAAIGGAVASIIVRKIGQDERSAVLLLYPMVANFVLMASLLPFVYQPMPIDHLGAAFLIAFMGFLATLCIISAYKIGEAATVAPMQYSQILWATFFGAVFFDEQPDIATAIGAAVIIASGIYIVVREGGKTDGNQPVLRHRSRFEMGANLRVSQMLRRRRRNEKKRQSTDR